MDPEIEAQAGDQGDFSNSFRFFLSCSMFESEQWAEYNFPPLS